MFKDRDKLYQIYHTILSMALTWAFVLALNDYYFLRVHVAISAVMSLVISVLVYLIDYYRKNTVTYLLLLSIPLASGLIFWIKRINPITWMKELGKWVLHYDCSEELYQAPFAHIVLLVVAIFTSILFYLIVRRQILKLILAFGIFGLMIFLSIHKVIVNKLVVGICIFYLLNNVVELSGVLYHKRVGRIENKSGILYLAPICILLAVISVGMPSKAEPIQWKGVKYIYQSVKDKIDNLVTEWQFFTGKAPGEFTLAFTGYSEDSGELGSGELAQDDKIALMVGGHKGYSPAYLIGSVSDIYTGYSWEKSRKDYLQGEEEYYLDYIELVYALSRQDREMLDTHRLVERRVMQLKYNHIKTKTFFYPPKSSWYEVYSRTDQPNTASANISFPEAEGDGTRYQCVYYEMNLKAEEFQQMLREADSFSYEDSGYMNAEMLQWLENGYFYHDNVDSIMKQWNFYELLRDRSERINNSYINLPETLPDRVHQLALDITKDADTTYDKLKAIETYLNSYTYNLKPGRFPKGSDFVDYFLFDNKQGYCTSFATSMAVLARCIGIPTRYVEGFIVDYKDKIHTEYAVRNSKAHSWAEAYIEGFGWVPFEATPNYYNNRYVTWRGYDKTKSESTSAEVINPYVEFPSGPPIVDYTGNNREFGKETEESATWIGVITFILSIITLILILAIYYLVLRYQYRKAFLRGDYSRKMYLTFIRIMKLLKQEGFHLSPYDTILMVAERVRDLYLYEGISFMDVAEIFMRYRYAEDAVTEKEFMRVTSFYHGLLSKKREETGRLRMHLEEFLFLAKKTNR